MKCKVCGNEWIEGSVCESEPKYHWDTPKNLYLPPDNVRCDGYWCNGDAHSQGCSVAMRFQFQERGIEAKVKDGKV